MFDRTEKSTHCVGHRGQLGGTVLWRLARRGALALVLAACSDPKVVAEVGSSRIMRADVQFLRDSRTGSGTSSSDDLVNGLVRRELLAEGARKDGVVDDAVRAKVAAAEREILAQAYLEKRLSGTVTEEAARARYDAKRDEFMRRRVHVQHIVVRVPPQASEDTIRAAESKALRASAQIQSGRDFGEAAREFSDDAESAARNGELPVMSDGQTDATFFAAAVALRKGELSPVIQTPLGFHVIRALEAPRQELIPFETVKGRILAELRAEQETRILEGLKKRFSVKIHAERLAKGVER